MCRASNYVIVFCVVSLLRKLMIVRNVFKCLNVKDLNVVSYLVYVSFCTLYILIVSYLQNMPSHRHFLALLLKIDS